MKFGIFLNCYYPDVNRPYNELVAEMVDLAQAAEDLGYDAASVAEHHFVNYICNPSVLKYCLHVADRTRRIRVQTAVIVVPWYNPLALAEEIALVDHMSGGRLDIGLARGANKYEFDRLGIPIDQGREMTEEAIDIMLRAFTEEDFEHHGRFWQFDKVTTLPRPYQKPYPPIWITAQSPAGLRDAARRGFHVMNSPLYGCFAPFEAFEYTMGEYYKALQEAGTEKKEFGIGRRVYIAPTQQEAESVVGEVLRHWGHYMAFFKRGGLDFRVDVSDVPVQRGAVVPARFDDIPLDDLYNRYDDPILCDPEHAVRKIKRYEELGVTFLTCNTSVGIPHKQVLKSMELFAKEVMPHFKEQAKAATATV